MKRVIIITMIIALAFFSCKKEEAQTQGSAASGATRDAVDTSFNSGKYGYVLRVNAAFCSLETGVDDEGNEANKTKYATAMSLGERVLVGEKLRATYQNGTAYDFVKVRRDNGETGAAFALHVSDGGSLVVVVDERANLFSSPKSVDVTSILLPRKIVAVSFPETESDGFVEIMAFDSTIQTYRQNYVRTSAISGKASDIQSSILLQTAEPLNDEANKIRRDALLEMALLDYPDSVFYADIIALMTPSTVIIQAESVDDNVFIIEYDDSDY